MSMTSIRQWHSYIGLFIAPSILFFALTGAMQLFSLHEAHGSYHPPALIEKLGSVHKDQVFALGDHHPPPAPAEAAGQPDSSASSPSGAKDDDDDKVALPTLILKWFFLLVAVSLILSTVLGLWMGLVYTRRKRVAWSLLAAGALIPTILLLA
jgi:hypothetical protein